MDLVADTGGLALDSRRLPFGKLRAGCLAAT